MRKNLLPWTAALGIAATLVFTSCTYDPYHTSVGGTYSSGYGYGHGYGGSNFSTSLFVSTGDPRWGYDPYSYSYFDYRTRRYYDPYLYGYYPIGYRPPVVYGVPHPHGWRPGSGYCPPPRTVRNMTMVNYRDRESAYRSSNHSWAKQVRQKSYSDHSGDGQRGETRTGSRPSTRGGSTGYDPRTSSSRDAYTSPQSSPRQTWDRSDTNRGTTDPRSSLRTNSRIQNTERYSRGAQQGRLPSGYQSPVTRPPSYPSESSARGARAEAPRYGTRPNLERQAAVQAPSPPRVSRGEGRSGQPQAPAMRSREASPQPGFQRQPEAMPEPSQQRGENRRGLRSLGEG